MKRNLFFLYMMELCAGAARGSYLVCIGWTTLIVIGDVAAVGQVFIVAMIMCFSPTLVKLSSTSSYFLFWGVVVVISTAILWLRQPGDDSQRLVVDA